MLLNILHPKHPTAQKTNNNPAPNVKSASLGNSTLGLDSFQIETRGYSHTNQSELSRMVLVNGMTRSSSCDATSSVSCIN